MMNYIRKCNGQSTLEYMVIVTSIVSFLILALKPNGFFVDSVTEVYTSVSVNGVRKMSKRMSIPGPPVVPPGAKVPNVGEPVPSLP